MDQTRIVWNGINSCELFMAFTEEEKTQIANTAVIKDYGAGENIFTIRHKDTYFYLVYSGILSLRLKSRKIKKYFPGEVFGEVSIFTQAYRLGNITAVEDSKLIGFDIKKIFDLNIVNATTQLKLLKKLTNIIIGYFYEDKRLTTQQIIENGESHVAEFKESMNAKNKSFKEKIVRTFSAFMNLHGGTLLIGIRDDGHIVGVEEPNHIVDEFIRSVIDIMNYRLGEHSASLIEFDLDQLDNKKVLRIDCEKSMSPVFFQAKDGQEEFVIRTATRNKIISKTSEIVKYFQENFTG